MTTVHEVLAAVFSLAGRTTTLADWSHKSV
jgi:hypothetical protein